MAQNRVTILDIGPDNVIGRGIASEAGLYGLLYIYDHTENDLDFVMWHPTFLMNLSAVTGCKSAKANTVFCFEIIEHLCNPLLFLHTLKGFIAPDAQIFLTYPSRMHFFWVDTHFHEYDQARFRFLVEKAGYKILVHERSGRLSMEWWRYFLGIRPLLRFIFATRTNMYVLALDSHNTERST